MRPHPQTQSKETRPSSAERPHYISASLAQPESMPSNMSTSVLSPQRPVIPKRPKLSLQTSTVPIPFAPKSANALSISHTHDSPTLRNTYSNAFRVPNTIKLTSPQQTEHYTSQSKLKEFSSPHGSSPSQHSYSDATPSVPYYLPMGARGILRNSPIPPRHVSATSARAPRRIFPPIKRVMFHETLVELMPTPVIEESEPSDTDSDSSTSIRKRGRPSKKDYTEDPDEPEEPEDMPSTPVQGRWKRKREWVWTIGPSEDGRMSPDAGPLLRQDSKISEAEAERIADERPMFRDPISSRPFPKQPASPVAPAGMSECGFHNSTAPDVLSNQSGTEHPIGSQPDTQDSDQWV